MIEKFTPEELEQIKAELGQDESRHKKQLVVAEPQSRLMKKLRQNYPQFADPDKHKVGCSMRALCDVLTENYVQGRTCKRYASHSLVCDPRDYAEVYRKIADTICFIIDHDLPAMRKKGKADERD